MFTCDLSGLPDEQGRVEILDIHTSRMRKNNKLAADVDLDDLAKRTRNFSGSRTGRVSPQCTVDSHEQAHQGN